MIALILMCGIERRCSNPLWKSKTNKFMSSVKTRLNIGIDDAIRHLEMEFGQIFPEEFFYRDPRPRSDRTFEIGLCLAGSVSAGAYLAGVVDFLIEAIDEWEKAKATDRAMTPDHNVRISGLSGTSGGGMTALILGTLLNRQIVPARLGVFPTFDQNPLYGAWVKEIDLKHLLDTKDLDSEATKLQAFLNSTRITDLARKALISNGTQQTRSYVANPLHVGVTVANLNGTAYQFDLRTPTAFGYQARVHEDAVRFALTYPTPPNQPTDLRACPNEQKVDLSQRPTSVDETTWPPSWQLVRQAATATGAFPAGLLPREVLRDWSLFDPKILPLNRVDNPASKGAGRVAILPSLRGASAATDYSCLGVDGGCFNNEPFEIARSYLSGILGSNPRDGETANRAVIMVDPLVEPDKDAFERIEDKDTVLNFVSGLVFRAFKNQTRTHLPEWTAAMADDLYSRYLITPVRGGITGDAAICGSVLGAFGGFIAEDYREHDFRLGRRNCQKFLRDHFTLPIGNPLFDGWRATGNLSQQFAPRGANGTPDLTHLPIIPLVGSAAIEEPATPWPSDVFATTRETVYELIEQRIDAVYPAVTRDFGWLVRTYLRVGWWGARRRLLKAIQGIIEGSLIDRGLFQRSEN